MQPIDETYGDFVGTDMWNTKNPVSEDCLYLNVWTPVVDNKQPTVLKAVMVRDHPVCDSPIKLGSLNLILDSVA